MDSAIPEFDSFNSETTREVAITIMKTVHIDASTIHDWETFFEAFSRTFGFPDFFGRNMNAWIDCMSSLDEEFSEIQATNGEFICIALDNAEDFKRRCPEQFSAFVECSGFVNWRRREIGEPAILILSFHA